MFKFTQTVAVGIFAALSASTMAQAQAVDFNTMVDQMVSLQVNEARVQITKDTLKSIHTATSDFNYPVQGNRVLIKDLKAKRDQVNKTYVIAKLPR